MPETLITSNSHDRRVPPVQRAVRGLLVAAMAAMLSTSGPVRAEPAAQLGEIHPVCLIGEWHVEDLTSYARSAMRLGTIDSASGPYFWTFNPDGSFSQSADVTVNATSPIGDRFEQRMLLISSGTYRDSIDAVLTFSGVLATGNVDVWVNGEPFIQGADPTGLTVSEQMRISYACNGDRLTLQPDFGDGRVALMNLQRHHRS